MQVIEVQKNDYYHCVDICKEAALTFCNKNEENFVPSFGIKKQFDRCCDDNACRCICTYKCATFESIAQKYKVTENQTID